MKDNNKLIKYVFRSPVFPVIIISHDKLLSASNFKTLTIKLLEAIPQGNENIIKTIDSTGKEFWYNFQNKVFAPGFSFKRWTKMKMIELFNNSSNAIKLNKLYSTKSISNKKLAKIIKEICELVEK